MFSFDGLLKRRRRYVPEEITPTLPTPEFEIDEVMPPPKLPDIPAIVLQGMRADLGNLQCRVQALESRAERDLEVSVTRQGDGFQALVNDGQEYRAATGFSTRSEALVWCADIVRLQGEE